MTSFEKKEDMLKRNDLFRGHVTREQLKHVLMQPPLFREHNEHQEQVGGTIDIYIYKGGPAGTGW